MKMMNQIESDVAGRIRAALIKNGEPVGLASHCSSSNSHAR
jgi:biotin carboxyl carrier protein